MNPTPKKQVPAVAGASTVTKRHKARKPKPAKDYLEIMLLGQMTDAGLPAPVREFRFAHTEIGREWRADFAWPGLHFLVEVEGGGSGGRHRRFYGYEEDCIKYNWVSILNYKLVRVTARMVKNGQALAMVVEAFKRL